MYVSPLYSICGANSSPTLPPPSPIGPLHHLGLPLVPSDPPLLTLEVMLSPLDLGLLTR
jgi:hypothetical protein